jgi:hypothetical protein
MIGQTDIHNQHRFCRMIRPVSNGMVADDFYLSLA